MSEIEDVRLLIRNTNWKSGPYSGFLTPTAFLSDVTGQPQVVYGAVRDELGRGVIRGVSVSDSLSVLPFDEICFDRRNSDAFDTDGTILGHVNSVNEIIRLYYVGFRRSKKVKFQAFSGLAESYDMGKSFVFKQRILDKQAFPFIEGNEPDIVACHWNNLDLQGNGFALIAIGNSWLKIGSVSYPKYSSYMIAVENFQYSGLISKFPQTSDIYRLGRPRFLPGEKQRIAVATGGKPDGDYRPYFFEFMNDSFIKRADIEFPINPGHGLFCQQQVSYPELVKWPNQTKELFLFNGDQMGIDGCFGFETEGW